MNERKISITDLKRKVKEHNNTTETNITIADAVYDPTFLKYAIEYADNEIKRGKFEVVIVGGLIITE